MKLLKSIKDDACPHLTALFNRCHLNTGNHYIGTALWAFCLWFLGFFFKVQFLPHYPKSHMHLDIVVLVSF